MMFLKKETDLLENWRDLFRPGKAALLQFAYGILITFILTFLASGTLGASIAAFKEFLQRTKLREPFILLAMVVLFALSYYVIYRSRLSPWKRKPPAYIGQGWFFVGVLLNTLCICYFQIGGGISRRYIIAISFVFILAVLRGAPKTA